MGQVQNFIGNLDSYYFSVPNITFSSILDILIVSVVIYNILKWIKSTKVWNVLRGVVVLFVVYLFAYIFQLYTITWIINNTLNVGLIAVIIIFQPEIRSALEHMGRSSMFSFNDKKKKGGFSKSIDEIILACNHLRKNKTGALIVVEQETFLNDIISTGVIIDGKVTSQLLINIFEDKTPLHDGAVIIGGNKILAASCILPLTSKDVDKSFGTRHRAAIGMSESSDAYVIVVSEETGQMSFAKNGEIYRDVTDEEIKKQLKYDEKIGEEKEAQQKITFGKRAKNSKN
ncbi:MAG: diadenylate cyclase CdaA [Lachnospirales bacterium]